MRQSEKKFAFCDPAGNQKQFFERDPRRLATVVFGNPKYPRNIQKKLAFIADMFALCGRVLELGAGRGSQLQFLLAHLNSQTAYVGIDLAHGAIVQARDTLIQAHRQRALLATASADALPFADGTFDGVFCVDVLHHVSSASRTLTEVARLLRGGGRVVCVEPNPIFPVNLVYLNDPIERGLFRLTKRNAEAWVRTAGLVDLQLTNLPVFFPSFPLSLNGLYERVERLLGLIPGIRRLSTARVLIARRAC